MKFNTRPPHDSPLTRYSIQVFLHGFDGNTIQVIQGGPVNGSPIDGSCIDWHPVHILQRSAVYVVSDRCSVDVLCRFSLGTEQKFKWEILDAKLLWRNFEDFPLFTSTTTEASFSTVRLTRPRKMFCSLMRKGSGYTAQSSHARKHDITRCWQKKRDKGGEVMWMISGVWCTPLVLDVWYLKVLALKVALDRFVCCIEVWENLAELRLKTVRRGWTLTSVCKHK